MISEKICLNRKVNWLYLKPDIEKVCAIAFMLSAKECAVALLGLQLQSK